MLTKPRVPAACVRNRRYLGARRVIGARFHFDARENPLNLRRNIRGACAPLSPGPRMTSRRGKTADDENTPDKSVIGPAKYVATPQRGLLDDRINRTTIILSCVCVLRFIFVIFYRRRFIVFFFLNS